MKKTIIICLTLLLVCFVGCGAKNEEAVTSTAEASSLPEGHPDVDPSAPPPSGGASLAGKIAETMTSGGYTYMRLDTDSGETWVAVPVAEVEVGQDITVSIQMEMKDFESSSLGRTFESIIFATMGGPAPPASGDPHGGAPGMNAMGTTSLEGPIDVEKAEGPDGKTVAELWAERQELSEKIVSVRGKVVKFRPQIMGTNWIHLRDGSGNESDGTHDITITSDDFVDAGDIVTAKGLVRIDHDLGAGYNYPVIIESAKLTK